LRNLFNGCLDISRLDAGVVERADEDFRVATFLDGLDSELTQQAREKDLQFTWSADESVVNSDSMLLGRIFRNLVNNAIQNTDTGSISVVCQQKDDVVVLSVADTGKGIPESEKSRIFSEFHQVDSNRARMDSGLGLALAIVKRLCELLKITIELDSTIDVGSTFTLLIPKGTESNIVQEAEELVTVDLRGAHVLIIDDDKYIRHGMETLLQACGCITASAADASLALSSLQAQSMKLDLIVADYHLSNEMTGTTAIQEIRAAFRSDIPAVIVTGDTTATSKQEADKHTLRILYKPVSSELLLSTISSELAQAGN
jgi:CheY-like chemotaxis protein